MAVISVTDSGSSIYIDDGNSVQRIPKGEVSVQSRGDNVEIRRNNGLILNELYTGFTAPTGASASAVANSIEAFLDTASAVVTLGAGTVNAGIIGSNVSVGVNITRPSNTTTYTINDVVNDSGTTPLLFTNVGRANDLGGWVLGGIATSNAAQATLPMIDLMLFSSTFTIAADNAAFAPTNAQMATYLGKIRLATWINRGVRSESDGTTANTFVFTPGSGTRDIYGVAVVQNAYVPVSAEIFRFTINAERY